MTKIILHGCNGHMGQTVVNIVNEKEGCEIVAGVDTRGDAKNGFPVFSNINEQLLLTVYLTIAKLRRFLLYYVQQA